jgi:hypothetical protein
MISSLEEIRSLLETYDEASRLRIRNEAIEPSVQLAFASAHPEWHEGLLLNKKLSDAALHEIAQSSRDIRVRRLLASRSHLPDETLEALAFDDDPDVRFAIARHASTSTELRERLSHDLSLRVQSAAFNVSEGGRANGPRVLGPLLADAVPPAVAIGSRRYRRRWIVEFAGPAEHAVEDLSRHLTAEVQARSRSFLPLGDEHLPGIVVFAQASNVLLLEVELMADALEFALTIDREAFLVLARLRPIARLQGWRFDLWASYWEQPNKAL